MSLAVVVVDVVVVIVVALLSLAFVLAGWPGGCGGRRCGLIRERGGALLRGIWAPERSADRARLSAPASSAMRSTAARNSGPETGAELRAATARSRIGLFAKKRVNSA
eukprot:354545-Chlamydomonas_euryale.AAC.10